MTSPQLRYLPITQQPYCCVPAAMQMVLLRRSLPLLTQEEIGNAFDLTVPVNQLHLLPHAATGELPPGGWGTQIPPGSRMVNEFLRRHHYPLREQYHALADVPVDVLGWIDRQLQDDVDILVCFDYQDLFSYEDPVGHVAVVDSIDEDMIVLIDPWWGAPKVRPVTAPRLARAIESLGPRRRAGFWVLRSTR